MVAVDTKASLHFGDASFLPQLGDRSAAPFSGNESDHRLGSCDVVDIVALFPPWTCILLLLVYKAHCYGRLGTNILGIEAIDC